MKYVRIVAAGRGRSMSLPKIVDSVLKLANQSSTVKIVYLGTATYDKEEPYLLQTEGYRRLSQCEVVKLDVSEACETLPSAEEIQKMLETAHVVLVSGGNTLYAMNRWHELGIDKILTRISESTVLCGGSAGAIVWFEHGHSDSMDPTTFLHVDPNLTDEQKKDWKYIL
jgi:dipeptidase E